MSMVDTASADGRRSTTARSSQPDSAAFAVSGPGTSVAPVGSSIAVSPVASSNRAGKVSPRAGDP